MVAKSSSYNFVRTKGIRGFSVARSGCYHPALVADYPAHMIRWFAILPFLAMLVGPFFVNQVTPFVLRHAVPAGLVRGLGPAYLCDHGG